MHIAALWMKHKEILGAATKAGGLGLLMIMISYVDGKVEDVHARIDNKEKYVREYVDLRHVDVAHRLDSIEKILTKIDSRLYELVKKEKDNGL